MLASRKPKDANRAYKVETTKTCQQALSHVVPHFPEFFGKMCDLKSIPAGFQESTFVSSYLANG